MFSRNLSTHLGHGERTQDPRKCRCGIPESCVLCPCSKLHPNVERVGLCFQRPYLVSQRERTSEKRRQRRVASGRRVLLLSGEAEANLQIRRQSNRDQRTFRFSSRLRLPSTSSPLYFLGRANHLGRRSLGPTCGFRIEEARSKQLAALHCDGGGDGGGGGRRRRVLPCFSPVAAVCQWNCLLLSLPCAHLLLVLH